MNCGSSENKRSALRVCHLALADLWAGAEVQLVVLLGELVRKPEIQVSAVLFNENRVATELRALGIPVMVFPERGSNLARLLWSVVQHCRRYRFDVLHTHKYKDNILGTVAARIAGNSHVVRTIHGLPEPFKGIQAVRMRVNEWCDELVNRRGVSRLIAVSSEIECALSSKYEKGKIMQIYNGIPLDRINSGRAAQEAKRILGLPAGSYLIGTVGRLTAIKGHQYFLECASHLLSKRRDVYFAIVGDGPLLKALKVKAKQLGIERNVVFLGHREDVYDLVSGMDIFVLPSLHEGIPIALLEAMALGRPIVASEVGGVPEVLTNQVNGILVPPADSAKLSEACWTFLVDPSFARSCADSARARVEKHFSSRTMGEKVASLYFDVVAGSSKPAHIQSE